MSVVHTKDKILYMSLDWIKQEIKYYTGKIPTEEEATEIKWIAEEEPNIPLDEIISDYYSC